MDYTETLLTVPEAAHEVRQGRMLLLVDHGKAWLCLPAQFARADTVAQFLQLIMPTRLTVVASGARLEALHIVPEATTAREDHGTPPGVVTNRKLLIEEVISACRILAHPAANPALGERLARSQHFSLWRAHPGGLLRQHGPAEAALDLLRIAGLECAALVGPAGNNTDILAAWDLGGVLRFDEIVRYRKERRTSLVTQISLPTPYTTFRLWHFQEIETGQPYLALTTGVVATQADGQQEKAPLLRLHSACATGDIFGSRRCDCQAQMHSALTSIAREGRGVFLYLPQEGRGIGLAAKLQAYRLQEQGYDTLEANEQLGYPVDAREYDCAVEILRELGIMRARLLTNNPRKMEVLRQHGISVERVPLETIPTSENRDYLQAKLARMGHLLSRIE